MVDNVKALPNTLKVRGELTPIQFGIEDGQIALSEGTESSGLRTGDNAYKQLREHIEPWLTALFQSEHLSLLAGSGLTHAVHHMAAGELAAGMKEVEFSQYNREISKAAENSANAAGRDKNFEDQLRVANELLRGLEIIDTDDDADKLRGELNEISSKFASSILLSETNIATADEEPRQAAIRTLVTFLMSFASRTGTRDRINIFTTNYDRLIEAGAEFAGLHLLDRFLGDLMPIFRSSRMDLDMHYNPPGIRGEPRYLEGVARFTKLHGSVDWVQADDDIRRIGLPFGASEVEPYLAAPGLYGATAHQLMVYPNAAKDRETADYPYVELFRDLAASLCRPNSTLVTYGYSFGDEHINRVIRDMLTIPSTHVVIISRDGWINEQGAPARIQRIVDDIGRPSQISLLIGPDIADLQTLTTRFLPKASIDKTTFRMSELLQHRWGASGKQENRDADNAANAVAEDTP